MEILQKEESGKRIAQQNGVTFSVFRRDISAAMDMSAFDEDDWYSLCRDYFVSVDDCGGHVDPVEWAVEWFERWDEETRPSTYPEADALLRTVLACFKTGKMPGKYEVDAFYGDYKRRVEPKIKKYLNL